MRANATSAVFPTHTLNVADTTSATRTTTTSRTMSYRPFAAFAHLPGPIKHTLLKVVTAKRQIVIHHDVRVACGAALPAWPLATNGEVVAVVLP